MVQRELLPPKDERLLKTSSIEAARINLALFFVYLEINKHSCHPMSALFSQLAQMEYKNRANACSPQAVKLYCQNVTEASRVLSRILFGHQYFASKSA